MSQLLLTGFKPFLGEKVNPSQMLIEAVRASAEYREWVDTEVLSVSFKKSPEELLEKFNQGHPKAILMLGQAGGRSKICLERVALNWVETNYADELGYKPQTGPIDAIAPRAQFSNWPLAKVEHHLKHKNIPVEVSFSAGAFVCNYLYFRVASEVALMNIPTLFVHVPFLPQQTLDKESSTAMSFETMRLGIFEILEFLKKNPF